MTAPPLFRIFHLGEHQPRLDGIENALVEHAGDDRRGTADVQIEMAHAGFEFVCHAAHSSAAACRENLHFDAVTFFECLFDLPFHLGAGGKRNRHLALFLGGFDQFVPFKRAGGFVLLSVCRRCEHQSDKQKNSSDNDLDGQTFISKYTIEFRASGTSQNFKRYG